METIGVRELQQNAGHYVQEVRNGATLLVSNRGTVVAQLSPIGAAHSKRDELLRAGRLVAAPHAFNKHAVTVESAVVSNDEILTALRDDRV